MATEEEEKKRKEAEELERCVEEEARKRVKEEFERRLPKESEDEGSRGKGRKPSSSGGGLLQYAAMVVLALIISYVMTTGFAVSKSDFAKNIQSVVASVESAKADIKATKDSVTLAVSNLPNTVSAQVNTAINVVSSRLSTLENTVNNAVSQMGGVSKSVSEANSKVDSLTATVNTQTSTIATLQDRITALEAKILPTTNQTSGVITAEIQVQYLSYISLSPASGNNTVVAFPVRLKLINNTTKALTDIKLNVSFAQSVYYETPTWVTGYPQLSGGSTTWVDYSNVYSFGMMFVNGWDLTLAANETKTLNLSLSVNLAKSLVH